jgi:hypothetical protein
MTFKQCRRCAIQQQLGNDRRLIARHVRIFSVAVFLYLAARWRCAAIGWFLFWAFFRFLIDLIIYAVASVWSAAGAFFGNPRLNPGRKRTG